MRLPDVFKGLGCAGVLWALAACSVTPVGSPVEAPAGASPAAQAAAHVGDEAEWAPFVLPGKRATEYRFTNKEGRRVISARADGSSSMLRRPMNLLPDALSEVSWSWWVEDTLSKADLADVDRSDAPASLVFAFDGDKSKLPARTRMMFDLARTLSGEEPPYATLVYAWATETPLETVVKNPRSDRIRKIVVDTGTKNLRLWREHRRNLVQDYITAFGEPPGRLLAVGVMTDADNTRSKAKAWYGPIRFHAPASLLSPLSQLQQRCGNPRARFCSEFQS